MRRRRLCLSHWLSLPLSLLHCVAQHKHGKVFHHYDNIMTKRARRVACHMGCYIDLMVHT